MRQAVRIYQRVSTKGQNLDRQNFLINEAQKKGYYIAGVYSEKASGAILNRPELMRLIDDLQEGDILMAESIDRITRLNAEDADVIVNKIRAKKAIISVEGFQTLPPLKAFDNPTEYATLQLINEIMLKVLIHMSVTNYLELKSKQRKGIEQRKLEHGYPGRKPNLERIKSIISLRKQGLSIREIAENQSCSQTLVKTTLRREKERATLPTKTKE